MDEAEKRRLKKLGKNLVEQQSQDLRERLREANPAPVGSDEWATGYRAGVERERQLRAAPPDRLSAEDALREFVLQPVEGEVPREVFGVPGRYRECPVCRDLLHSLPQHTISCACGNLLVDIESLQVASRSIEPVRLVKLIGRAEPGAPADGGCDRRL
jgi:hypothetical protein